MFEISPIEISPNGFAVPGDLMMLAKKLSSQFWCAMKKDSYIILHGTGPESASYVHLSDAVMDGRTRVATTLSSLGIQMRKMFVNSYPTR